MNQKGRYRIHGKKCRAGNLKKDPEYEEIKYVNDF